MVSRVHFWLRKELLYLSLFLFRLNYVRYLQHSNTVAAASISRTTGDIATVSHSGKFWQTLWLSHCLWCVGELDNVESVILAYILPIFLFFSELYLSGKHHWKWKCVETLDSEWSIYRWRQLWAHDQLLGILVCSWRNLRKCNCHWPQQWLHQVNSLDVHRFRYAHGRFILKTDTRAWWTTY